MFGGVVLQPQIVGQNQLESFGWSLLKSSLKLDDASSLDVED